METNTDKRKTLIRRLLVEQLLPEEKQNLLKRNSVENEMKKQWKQFEDDPIKSEVKKRIWKNVQRRCEGKSDTLVQVTFFNRLIINYLHDCIAYNMPTFLIYYRLFLT